MKKISICGKGGSGKSTVVALLSNELRQRGWRVLVVDSDESNSGLHWMLGFEHPPRPLLELVGGKKDVQRHMSQPEVSVLARPEIQIGDLPAEYFVEADGRWLVAIGKIHQALEGCACPMGVVSREFLKKLRLEKDQIAVVDMEAGIEHFGRGIETSIDAVVTVVEPSLESIALAEKVKQLASGAGANFMGGILNKVDSEGLSTALTAELYNRNVPVIGVIRYHDEIVKAGLSGQRVDSEQAAQEAAAIVDALLDRDISSHRK